MKDIQFSNTINTTAITSYKTPYNRINKMFGDGLFFPSVFMLYGNPGSGKTTLLSQLCYEMQLLNISSIACIGEMKLELSAAMCNRLRINIPITDKIDIDFICDVLIKEFRFVIIDSLQVITYDRTKHKFKQQEFINYCIKRIYDAAYEYKSCVGIIIHSTKNGSYKGSSFIPHMVDTQIKLTKLDENKVQAETIKNRYGKTGVWPFRLTQNGYILKDSFLERFFA